MNMASNMYVINNRNKGFKIVASAARITLVIGLRGFIVFVRCLRKTPHDGAKFLFGSSAYLSALHIRLVEDLRIDWG